jgi:MYXO-CTERM domain-containing protein
VVIQFVGQGLPNSNTGTAAFNLIDDPTLVPEPASSVLGLGALGLVALRRRRRA